MDSYGGVIVGCTIAGLSAALQLVRGRIHQSLITTREFRSTTLSRTFGISRKRPRRSATQYNALSLMT